MIDLETIFQGKMTPHKWNQLGEYLKGQTITAGKGLRMTSSTSSGMVIDEVKKKRFRRQRADPFSVLSCRPVPDSTPQTYKVQLQEGWIISRATKQNVDSLIYDEPEIGGVAMSADPSPELTMEDGEFALVQYDTDEEGFILGTPAIIVGSEQASDHHQPPSGEYVGAGGYYYVKLFQLNVVAGKPEIDYYQQTDIEHSRLWTGRNVGGARNVHKQWTGPDDRYDFRTLKQTEPVGRTYGKVIVDPTGPENDAVNDAIKFSAIAERDTDPQVNVNDNGAGIVTIEGNDKDGSLTWTDCADPTPTVTTLLEWEDGLITTAGAKNFTAGCGSDLPSASSGDVLYYNGTNWVALANPGDPSPNEAWALFHNGTAPYWDPVV